MRNFKVTVNGVVYDVVIEETAAASVSAPAAPTASAPATAPAMETVVAPAAASDANAVKAPFPGNVLRVNVKAGDAVKKGDVLCVIEALKMENDICAPQDGTIAFVAVSAGKSVVSDDVLVTFQ